MFLIGAAYFVAGSYPESLTLADLDSQHSMHLSTGTTVHGGSGAVAVPAAVYTNPVHGSSKFDANDVELGNSGKSVQK